MILASQSLPWTKVKLKVSKNKTNRLNLKHLFFSFQVDFHQPDKQGCHQLTVREDGVYTFGLIELNEANRDINRRYCKFATDGTAWTVIQRRELTDLQENFNRSWSEYKNGFGDLSNEFWFGNNFIHM